MTGEHAGRVALVIGGSQGIGSSAARALGREGSVVVVHGLTVDFAQEVAAGIVRSGGRAIAVAGPIDVASTSQAAVQAAINEYGRLDTLVVSSGVQRYGDVPSTSEDTWDEVFDVNVKGVFLAAKFALPYIRQSPGGSVAIVASVQATATQNLVAAYTASKGALVALGRSMAVDEARFGVRVNTISPGSVDTPMLRSSAALLSAVPGESADSMIAKWGAAHPLGRVATTDEVGEVICFVTSPRASFVTGADVRVDGGLLAQLGARVPASADREEPSDA